MRAEGELMMPATKKEKDYCLSYGSDTNEPQAILSDTELSTAWRFLNRMAKDVSEGRFVYQENRFSVEINPRELTLYCPGQNTPCEELSELSPLGGRTVRVCPKLQSLYEFVKSHASNEPVVRAVLERRKVEKFLYKLQPNQFGHNYWYIQYSVRGETKHIYLGKQRPLFDPRKDLETAARRRRARKKRHAFHGKTPV